MTEAVERGRGRWSTAVGLTFAVLLLSVFDGLALVLLPLAIFLVALPGERKARWVAVGVALWIVVLLLSGGTLAVLSRGWGLALGGVYLVVTVTRPRWDVTPRALVAVGISMATALLVLVVSGQIGALDSLMRDHFAMLSQSFVDLQARLPESARLANLDTAAERMTQLRSDLFPALLALQSLAALALVSWWVRRLGRSDSESFMLARMRDFRFNDQLIWILILAILFVLLPVGESAARIALNVLVFMAALYVLRGLAVFVYLATGSRSVPTMVFGALAVVLLYPVVFTAALLMGVGDTWLDVRRRLMTQTPT
jgi:hypothetical protein